STSHSILSCAATLLALAALPLLFFNRSAPHPLLPPSPTRPSSDLGGPVSRRRRLARGPRPAGCSRAGRPRTASPPRPRPSTILPCLPETAPSSVSSCASIRSPCPPARGRDPSQPPDRGQLRIDAGSQAALPQIGPAGQNEAVSQDDPKHERPTAPPN